MEWGCAPLTLQWAIQSLRARCCACVKPCRSSRQISNVCQVSMFPRSSISGSVRTICLSVSKGVSVLPRTALALLWHTASKARPQARDLRHSSIKSDSVNLHRARECEIEGGCGTLFPQWIGNSPYTICHVTAFGCPDYSSRIAATHHHDAQSLKLPTQFSFSTSS